MTQNVQDINLNDGIFGQATDVPKFDAKDNSMAKQKMQDFGFLATLFAWPTIVIIITYFYANTNFIFLAFQRYVTDGTDQLNRYGWYEFLPIGEIFTNFELAWKNIVNLDLGIIARNSILNYLHGFIFNTPIQIFVGFSIYKKIKGVNLYIIILYLPSVIASMVWVMIYKQMIVYAIPALTGWEALSTMFSSVSGRGLGVLLLLWVYQAWTNMGGAMMIITGMFARIEHEMVEAAQIDGCNLWNEFWHISFPHYWPVYSIGLFTGIAGLFTGQAGLYEFYATEAPKDAWTFGYYFYKMVVAGYMESRKDYPEASAAGLFLTVVVVPLVLGVKKLVEKADRMEGAV